MSRSTLLPAVLGVLAVALGGCGDDDVFRTDRPILRLELDEYRVVPPSIVVDRPKRMKFDVRNGGRLTHNLAIQIPEGPDGRPVEIARTETMHPGERGEPIKATLQPGEYRIVCTIANHDDLGQYGTLKVQR
ncbi:MAG TPA: cupredoxin domain-containing protein [Solirubrobacteraceae bacterium]|nr:cupredoxin domain-containing protein [Solirubrobacteraceae bacterium]